LSGKLKGRIAVVSRRRRGRRQTELDKAIDTMGGVNSSGPVTYILFPSKRKAHHPISGVEHDSD